MAVKRNCEGHFILKDSLLNKSTAFNLDERKMFGLNGLLPYAVESADTQLLRIFRQMDHLTRDIDKYMYLSWLQDVNETLFYRVLMSDPSTYLKIVYDPTVGEACLKFGHIFRNPRGLYITIKDKGYIKKIIENWPNKDVRFVVVTDGSRILGLGDLGINGMPIPIGKLALYTAVGAVPPECQLPIMLDVGTDNIENLNDPLYMGIRQPRVIGKEYDEFIEEFMVGINEIFTDCCIQFEDFANYHAIPILAKYRNKFCMFNDDIQGTASVTLSAFYSATHYTKKKISDHRVLFLGAGSAATGTANLISYAMTKEGLSLAEAKQKCWLFDTKGLVYKDRPRLELFKQEYAHDMNSFKKFDSTSFLECIKNIKPTAIVGFSTTPNLFTKEVIAEMAKLNDRPLILPLSNPTSQEECTAQEAYQHSNGRVLFAAGVKFDNVTISGKEYYPTQANNLWIYPAIGMAVYATQCKRITDDMFLLAAQSLSRQVSKDQLEKGMLFPDDHDIIKIVSKVAADVAL